MVLKLTKLELQIMAQLGLTLTSGRAPVRKLVLDHVQRPESN
jgi:hypothetical protein